jgi:hypothetical protein
MLPCPWQARAQTVRWCSAGRHAIQRRQTKGTTRASNSLGWSDQLPISSAGWHVTLLALIHGNTTENTHKKLDDLRRLLHNPKMQCCHAVHILLVWIMSKVFNEMSATQGTVRSALESGGPARGAHCSLRASRSNAHCTTDRQSKARIIELQPAFQTFAPSICPHRTMGGERAHGNPCAQNKFKQTCRVHASFACVKPFRAHSNAVSPGQTRTHTHTCAVTAQLYFGDSPRHRLAGPVVLRQ